MSNEYYVAGCVDNGLSAEVVEGEHAEFWTLYARDASGESQGIIDCVFREDAVAAMAVYVERDRLNEQVRALSVAYERMTYVLINEGIQVPDPKPAEVDTFLNEVRAQAVEGFANDCDDNFGLVEPEDDELYVLMAEAARSHAARIRKGEQP